jgi:hypothetical protein
VCLLFSVDATKKGGEVCALVAWVLGTALFNDFFLNEYGCVNVDSVVSFFMILY